MMRPLRLGLDLDGVFVNWNGRFLQVLETTSGRQLAPADYVPQSWHWYRVLGYKQSEVEAAWKVVDGDIHWWTQLEPLASPEETRTFFRALASATRAGSVVPFFLTQRPSPLAHQQSVRWLTLHGMTDPHVIITATPEGKGRAADLLQLDVFVDDYPDNCLQVAAARPECRTIMVNQPWNLPLRVPSLHSIDGGPSLPARLLMTLERFWGGREGLPSFTRPDAQAS